MKDLEKIIHGHLFDIKQIMDDIFALEEYFAFTDLDLDNLGKELKNSVEGGVLEYKRKTLSPIFSFLETLKYDSRGFDKLSAFIPPLTGLLYIVLTQRLIVKGTVKASEDKTVEAEGTGFDDQDFAIKDILADVQVRLNNQPEDTRNPRLQTILLQMKQYKTELEKKKSLEPNIPEDKRSAFEENYGKIFSEFLRKIRETYYDVLKDEAPKASSEGKPRKLSDYNLLPLEPLYRNQIELYSSLRSTLLFTVKERYNIREIIVDLGTKKQSYFSPPDKEEEKLHIIAPFADHMKQLVHLYTTTLIQVLERHASLLKAGF